MGEQRFTPSFLIRNLPGRSRHPPVNWSVERGRCGRDPGFRRLPVRARRPRRLSGDKRPPSSTGKFTGKLDRIEVEGQTEVPDFAVKISSHQAPLRTRFRAEVNAENGDTSLQQVDASFWKTTVSSQGSVAGQTGTPGETVSLKLRPPPDAFRTSSYCSRSRLGPRCRGW